MHFGALQRVVLRTVLSVFLYILPQSPVACVHGLLLPLMKVGDTDEPGAHAMRTLLLPARHWKKKHLSDGSRRYCRPETHSEEGKAKIKLQCHTDLCGFGIGQILLF